MKAVALVVGPAEHGVVRHARALATTAGWPVLDDPADAPPGSWVVLDVTDRLWGRTAEVSGPAVARALDTVHARGGRVAAALHDVPFDGDGPVAERRAAVYRGIMQRSDAVFVCSETERRRLAAIAPAHPRVAVLPIPVPPPTARPARPVGAPQRSVGVLGFLYPGKGHDEVLTAMADLPAEVPLVCLGRPADGHADLAAALARRGREVLVTGFLPDDDLAAWAGAVTMAVAPNRVVSASASIATWWSCGRRPLVPDVPYTREIGDDRSLLRYDDLAPALRAAFADPASTWITGPAPGPSVTEVAARRDAFLAGWDA
ncbi:hypothetical protein ACXR2U_06515 [Jatrophihabitans sp. YIM 134969]